MCTVTFISFGGTVFITSNRDESPSRQARGLTSSHTENGEAIYFPADEQSGGSWIALSETGRAVCLLNGAFEPFIPSPSYRLSRGQVVMEAARVKDAGPFLSTFPLDDIAPFTLLIYEKDALSQLIWDGHQRHLDTLPTDTLHLWSSVTLYSEQVRAWRRNLFSTWQKNRDSFNREDIIDFHQTAGGDIENDFVMNREDRVKTLSVTSIMLQPDSGSILHIDLERASREETRIRYAT